MTKKVIVYLRLEKDTGGDKAQLDWIIQDLTRELPKGADIEFNLFIQHDGASRTRVGTVQTEWGQMLRKHGFGGQVWLSEINGGKAHLRSPGDPRLPAPQHHNPEHWARLQASTSSLQAGDWLVVTWSHQMDRNTAHALRRPVADDGLGVSPETNFLLFSSLGKEVNAGGFKTALQRQGYNHIYCFEPGLTKPCGFSLGTGVTKTEMEKTESRTSWLGFIRADPHFNLIEAQQATGVANPKDKLLVIYHSKDVPARSGRDAGLRDYLNSLDLSAHSVILIGDEAAANKWQEVILEETNLPAADRIHRRGRTGADALRRGFHDAEYSLTTAPTTLKECEACGIMTVQFFPAPHVTALKTERDTALEVHREEFANMVGWSFKRGEGVHEELTAIMAENDFRPRLLVTEPEVIALADQEELANYAQALPKERIQKRFKAVMTELRERAIGGEKEEHDKDFKPAI